MSMSAMVMIIFRVFPQLSRSWLLLGQASEAARPQSTPLELNF